MTVSLKNFPDYKTVATDLLIPYARNSRTHSPEQIAQIAASIKEFGFLNPIIIDGENGIIAGHGRVMAAQKLGIDELPCVEAKHLTEAQRKAYVITDNKLALNADWDHKLLELEIEELKSLDFDLEILGWGENLPEFTQEIDYSILDDDQDEDYKKEIEDMASGVKKAIQIEFEAEHYDEAYQLVKFWRDQGAYVGGMLMRFLDSEREKI
jgi:hypothetical protein